MIEQRIFVWSAFWLCIVVHHGKPCRGCSADGRRPALHADAFGIVVDVSVECVGERLGLSLDESVIQVIGSIGDLSLPNIPSAFAVNNLRRLRFWQGMGAFTKSASDWRESESSRPESGRRVQSH